MTPRAAAGDDGDDGDDVVDLDLHCVPDPEHCVRLDDAHLDAVHVDDPSG